MRVSIFVLDLAPWHEWRKMPQWFPMWIVWGHVITYTFFQPGFHDAACRLVSFYSRLLLHGISALISTASFHFRALFLMFSLAGLRPRSPLRWFWWWSSSFQQSSRSGVGTHTAWGLSVGDRYAWWGQVYSLGLVIALWCISDTCTCHDRMIIVTYAICSFLL